MIQFFVFAFILFLCIGIILIIGTIKTFKEKPHTDEENALLIDLRQSIVNVLRDSSITNCTIRANISDEKLFVYVNDYTTSTWHLQEFDKNSNENNKSKIILEPGKKVLEYANSGGSSITTQETKDSTKSKKIACLIFLIFYYLLIFLMFGIFFSYLL